MGGDALRAGFLMGGAVARTCRIDGGRSLPVVPGIERVIVDEAFPFLIGKLRLAELLFVDGSLILTLYEEIRPAGGIIVIDHTLLHPRPARVVQTADQGEGIGGRAASLPQECPVAAQIERVQLTGGENKGGLTVDNGVELVDAFNVTGGAVADEEFVDPVTVDVLQIVTHQGFFILTQAGEHIAQPHVFNVLGRQGHVPVCVEHVVVSLQDLVIDAAVLRDGKQGRKLRHSSASRRFRTGRETAQQQKRTEEDCQQCFSFHFVCLLSDRIRLLKQQAANHGRRLTVLPKMSSTPTPAALTVYHAEVAV